MVDEWNMFTILAEHLLLVANDDDYFITLIDIPLSIPEVRGISKIKNAIRKVKRN